MTRNLKTLPLAIVAVLAMSTAASSASAQTQGKFSSDGPVTLIGTETGVAANALTAFGSIKCTGSTLTGHQYNVTPHALISSGATTATLTPHYKNCQHFNPEGHPATVTTNGCDYVLHVGVTAGGKEGTYSTTFDIVCPEGKAIEVHVYNDAITHKEVLCTLKIKAQTGFAGAHVTNTPASGDLDITGAIEKVHVEREGLCLLDGKGTTVGNAVLDIDQTVSGRNSGGESTPVSIVEQVLEEQGSFSSDGPVTLIGTETGGIGANTLTVFGSSIECPGSILTGHKYNVTPHALTTSGETTATLTPHYPNCVTYYGGSYPVTVTMNGCDYVLHVGGTTPESNVVGTYGVTADIVCPAGKSIEVVAYLGSPHASNNQLCKFIVTPKNGLMGPHITNTPGTGTFDINGTFGGIVAHREGLCVSEGKTTTETAQLHVDTTVSGKNAVGGATAVGIIG
jgi:hypothetical protein